MKSLSRTNALPTFPFILLALFSSLAFAPATTRAATEQVASETFDSDFCSLDPSLITWFPAVIECPVCGTKNIFLQWGSYGSYIYQYPSKYQLIFWPYTDSAAWYSCKTCRFTAFMGIFQNLPKEKIADLRRALEEVKLPAQVQRSEKDSMEHPPYLELSMSERLSASERVYHAL